jgi:hypothetical protein
MPCLPVAPRFWAKVNKTETCWLWTGTAPAGYGQISVNGKAVPSHRWAYEQAKGPIPNGLQLDHLCRVTRCVNPDHLEPVSARVNILRGEGVPAINSKRTHCKQGHPFTPENTAYIRGRHRQCRTCSNCRPPEVGQRKRASKRARGLCENCSEKIGTISTVRCDACALKHRERVRAYEARNKEAINARRRV